MTNRGLRHATEAAARFFRNGHIAIPVLFGLFLTAMGPWWSVYLINFDEGINLMKGALVADGYRLYSEIWSDQPPLFTYILAAKELLLQRGAAEARCIVLVFASILIGSFFRLIQRREGTTSAWFATMLLIGGPFFEVLSVSVMIGLPALSLAVLAMERAAHARGRGAIALSGCVFALAMLTKFFVLPLLPFFFLTFLLTGRTESGGWRGRIRDCLVWMGSAASTFALVAALLRLPILDQLIAPHLNVSRQISSPFSSAPALLDFLFTWPALVPAAVIGAIRVLMRRRAADLAPLLLAALTALILCNHAPLFNHQSLLVAIPAAWLAAIGFRDLLCWAMDDARGWPLRVPAAAACIVALFFALPDTKAPRRVFNITQPESREALKTLERWPGQHPWIVTDSPIDAYYAARLVPPRLAVYSKKRVASGHLPPGQIISEIQAFKPDQVMFRRPNIRPYPEVLSYLRRHYRQVPDQRWFHFIAKDGLAAASAGHATVTEDAALRDLATRVTRAFAGLSIHGGYSGFYDLEQDRLFERASDSAKTLPPDTITIRPPGSTALVGGCLLRIAQILDDYVALQHATNAARALACVQHPLGGWTATAGVSSECQPFTDVTEKNPLTLDEGTPGVVLDFLLDLRLDFETRGREAPDWLEHGIRRGFDFLLRTQLENGGWPRQDLKANPFSSLATLNDGVTSSAIAILLRGFETYRDDRLLQAARRGGQFLIKAQGRPPLAGWSQQYTSDLRPAAARSFEPAALASRESAQAMLALVDLYLATREPLFLEPLPRAAAWLAQSQTAPGRWARFYALDTNRPVYVDRDGSIHASVSELSQERRTGYQWEEAFPEVQRALRLVEALRAGGPDGLAEAMQAEQSRKQEQTLAKARENVRNLLRQDMKHFWLEDNFVSTPRFIANCKDVITCLRHGIAP